MKKILLILLLTGCNAKDTKQTNAVKPTAGDFSQKARTLVLSENNAGVTYAFKAILKDSTLEYKITYLGSITTKKGATLRLLNSAVYTSENLKRANAALFIYNADDQYLGSFNVGPASALPLRIEERDLVFASNEEECPQQTRISFTEDIPEKITIPCTKSGPAAYTFTTGDQQ